MMNIPFSEVSDEKTTILNSSSVSLTATNTAFSVLVKKYQKSVHALAWRKVGDFHIAEDITQDTFLKAYQKLSTLKKPQRFASWLYVIAANHCSTWLRKKTSVDTIAGRHKQCNSWKKAT